MKRPRPDPMIIPEGKWVSRDWSDGTTSTTYRECAVKFVAIYGEPDVPWRAATPTEIKRADKEEARLAAFSIAIDRRERARKAKR